jgi:hypothetical protein
MSGHSLKDKNLKYHHRNEQIHTALYPLLHSCNCYTTRWSISTSKLLLFFFRFINYYHVPYIWNDSINFFFCLDSYNISSLSFLVALFPSTRLAFFETTWAFHLFFNSTFITHNVNCLSVYPVCSWNGAYSLFCKSHLFNFAYGNCIPGMCWHCK